MFLKFGLIMVIVLNHYVPFNLAIFGLLWSNCLRAVCIFIVYKYRALHGQWPGFKIWGGGGGGGVHIPFRVHNQSPAQAQAGPSNQGQKV